MSLGERLKIARKNKGLTQKQLADYIGSKHNSVSDWENQKSKPDPDTIELICGTLDITPNYLLGIQPKTQILITKEEQDHLHKYRSIDNKGKHTVDTVLEMEYIRCNKPHLVPFAAHARDGATKEEIQSDLDMMDDDNF